MTESQQASDRTAHQVGPRCITHAPKVLLLLLLLLLPGLWLHA